MLLERRNSLLLCMAFNSGHIFSSIISKALHFDVLIAANPEPCGRALFHDIGNVHIVLYSSHDLLSRIASRKMNYIVGGYIIHCPRTLRHGSHTTFWCLQGNIKPVNTGGSLDKCLSPIYIPPLLSV